jgi:hypothetical protein
VFVHLKMEHAELLLVLAKRLSLLYTIMLTDKAKE